MHRLNFRLPKSLFDKFSEASYKAGVPKSHLLRDWVSEVDLNELRLTQIPTSTLNYSYNFLADHHFSELIKTKAFYLNISESEFLRNVIVKQVGDNFSNLSGSFSLKNLWERGKYDSVLELMDKLSDADLLKHNNIYFVSTLAEKGELDKAEQLISYLTSNHLSHNQLYELKVIEFDISYYKLNYYKLENLKKELIETLNLGVCSRNVKGKICLALGQYFLTTDDLKLAEYYLIRGIEYLDIINYPVEITHMYLFLSSVYALRLDSDNSLRYAEMAKRIALGLENKSLLVRVLNTLSTSNYRLGNIDSSKQYILDATKIDNMYITIQNKIYLYDDLGRLAMMEGNKERAINMYTKGIELKKASKHSYYSILESYVELIEHKKTNLSLVFREDGLPRINLRKYNNYANLFLYGNTETKKKAGLNGLKELTYVNNYPIVVNAAKHTLETKEFRLIR